MTFNRNDFEGKQRFSIRKLNIGVCSVLLSTLLWTMNTSQTVHADTTDPVETEEVESANPNNNSTLADTEVNTKNEQAPSSYTISQNENDNTASLTSTKVVAEVNSQKTDSDQTQEQKDTSAANTADKANTKDTSVQNTVEEDKTNLNPKQTNSDTQEKQNIKPVTPHADSTENIAPDPYPMDVTPPYVIAGSNLTDLASKFLKNGDDLIQSGAKISWVGDVPTPTQEDASDSLTITGTIKVTYADGTSTNVPIESMVEPQSQLQPNTFYYVNKVGDTPDFNTADINGNDLSKILYNQNVGNPDAFSYKVLGTVDTSEVGIHWANVQVTDNNTFNGMPGGTKVIGGPYVVQIPYVVQGLKLRDDIPVDASGNPIINAQLSTMPESTFNTPTTPQLAFDPTSNSVQGLWGQYFYQDYALAYALGINVSASNWTAPTDLVNTKTNHFTMTFSKLPNATQQEVAVNYVTSPEADDIYFYNAANRNYMTASGLNKTEISKLLDEGYLNDKVWVTLADGTKVYASKLSYIDNGQRFIVTNTRGAS